MFPSALARAIRRGALRLGLNLSQTAIGRASEFAGAIRIAGASGATYLLASLRFSFTWPPAGASRACGPIWCTTARPFCAIVASQTRTWRSESQTGYLASQLAPNSSRARATAGGGRFYLFVPARISLSFQSRYKFSNSLYVAVRPGRARTCSSTG